MPTYNYQGKTYDIPDGMVEDFERKRPDATIAYQRGETIYDIPLSRRDAFLKKFPDATLYGGEAKKEEDSLMKAQPMWGSASYDDNIAKTGSREYYPSPLNEQGRADYRPITIEDRAKQEYDMLMRQLSEFNIANGEFMDKYEASEKAARKQVNDGGFAMDSEQRRFIDANNADYRVKKQERDDLNNRLKNNSYFNELRTVEAESARETADGIGNMIKQMDAEDPELKRLSRARTMSATSPRGGFSGLTFAKRKEDVDEYQEKMADLEAAKRAYEKTAEIYEAPLNDGEDVLKRFFVGAGERADDLDFWTMGMSAVADDLNTRQAFQKIQDKFGSVKELEYMSDKEIDALLTPSEQILISAYMDNLNAMYMRMENTSGAYKAGQGAADSAMFMAQFLLTGGIGEAATSGAQKTLVNWLGRKVGSMSNGVMKNIARGATKLSIGTAESIGKALVMTPLMPHTYANISDKLMSFDDNGELMSVTDAIIGGAADSLIETWSESTGDFVNKVLGVPGSLVKGAFKKYATNVPFDAWGHAMRAPMMKLLRQGGFNGFLGEMGEEFIGNAVRSFVGKIAPGSGLDPNSLQEFAGLENLLVTAGSFAPMTVIGLGTSTAQYGWQKRKLENAQKAFEGILRNASHTDDQIKFAVDELLGSTDAHLTPEKLVRNFSPLLRELAYNDKFASNRTDAMNAAIDFMWEIARYRAYDGVYHKMEQQQIADMKQEIQEGTGREFWTTKLSDRAGMDGTAYETDEVRAVEFADGRVAYVLGSDGVQNTVIYNDGQTGFLSNEQLNQGKVDGTIVSDATMNLNDYLTQQVARVRMSEEETRMFEERGSNLEQIRASFPQGEVAHLGTAEAPADGTVIENTPDGAVIQMTDGSVRMATWEELGHTIGIEANPKTDAQQDEEIINNLEIADLQRRRERERRRSERRQNEEVAMAETQMVDEAVNEGIEHPIPMKSDGSVDQTAFWNESPARWAEWKTEQRQDGGAYAATYIENAMNILSGQIAENEAAFAAESDFDAKDALEQTIAQQKQRLAELADLYQRYAPAVTPATTQAEASAPATTEAETETQVPDVMAEREKFELDAEYQRRLSLAKSLTERVMILQEYFDSISGGSIPTHVMTKANYKKVMKDNGCGQEDIDTVTAAIALAEEENQSVDALHLNDAIYVIADFNVTIENGRRAFVHERQHNITKHNPSLIQRVLALGLGKDALANIVKSLSGTNFYSDKSEDVLADEVLSFAMEYAYTYDDFSLPLSMKGLPIELINLIKEINDEQRNDFTLANARRSKAQYDSPQGNSGQNDGNQTEVSGGSLGQEGTRPDEDSTRRAGAGSEGERNDSAVAGAGETEEEEVLAEVEPEDNGSFRVTKPEDENGVTAEQNDEINRAIGGEIEVGDEESPVRFSLTAIGHGAGLELIKDDGEGNVALVLPDGRKFNAHNLLKPEDIKSLPDTVLSYMMKDARMLGNIDARKEWMLWQKYTLMLNAILSKGSAENGGFENLASQWQWIADTVYKTVATNSDTQYSFSLDITRVCKKNEAVINAIAEMQARLGYGITPGQIMDIYMSTIEEGYQVPCPVCYVFSRYIRNGKYATIMINGQRKYGSKLVDPRTLSEKEKEKLVKYWLGELKKIEDQNEANKNEIARANSDITTLLDEIDKLSKQITDPRSNLTEEEKAEILKKIHELDARYKAALNVVSQSSLDSWITQFAIYKKKEGGKEKWVLYEDSYMGFPEEMALDLRQTSTVMRLYPAIQRFRKSRGAAAGKEITFVSNNDLGDVALALGSKGATENLATPRDMSDEEWAELQKKENGALMAGQKNLYQQAVEEKDAKKKAAILKKARERFASASEYAKRQSLRGGQRMWSWSDNIERLAPDVFVNLFQMEMLGGALQSYSKQLEGIKLVAAMNGYVNGSLMGKGNGYAEVSEENVEEMDGKYFLKGGDFVMTLKDGKKSTLRTPVYKHTDGKFYVLEFDDVVGIDAFGKDENGKHFKGLFELNAEYDKAGNILVGMNDLHIRIAMADDRIFFIIPWHSSGANSHILAQMYEYLGVEYDVTLSQDYTDVQSEKRIKGPGEKEEEDKKAEDGKEKKETVPVSVFLAEFWNDHHENAREYSGYGMVAGKDFPCGIEGGIASSDGNGNLSADQMHYRELRDAIFMGVKVPTGKTDKNGKPTYKNVNVEDYSEEWFNEIMNDAFLSQVYAKVREYMGEDGRMTSQDTKAIYPYEYWDETSTFATSSINGARYMEYCRRLGYKPKFCGKLDGKPENDYGNFTEDAGYWKNLIDRRMYGVDGKFQGLTSVTAENFTPDLVDPEVTKEEFVVTRVADEAGTQTIVDRAIEKEKSRPGGIATVNYDMSLDQALKAYTGAESVDLIEEAKKAVAKADAKKKSKKTKKSEVRMRITPEMDKAYMDAVEAGDMEAAQKMVDEAAVETGYTQKVYRVDEYKGDRNKYKNVYGGVFYAESLDYFDKSDTGHNRLDAKPFYLNTDGFFDPMNEMRNLIVNSWGDILGRESDFKKFGLVDETQEDRGQYADGEEILVTSTDGIAYSAQIEGYPGVIMRDIPQNDGKAFTEYAVYNSNNVKSADPVTYDDAGNVIPLSQRFNPENEDIRFRVRTDEQREKLFEDAKAHYGVTKNFNAAGYMLPDGSLLDFSEANDGGDPNSRSLDHRDIEGIIMDNGVEYDSRWMYIADFMNEGAIRLLPESAGINMIQAPTEDQRKKIFDFIYKYNGEVILEINDERLNSVVYMEYDRRTSPARIFRDIDGYFNEGIVPEQTSDLRFSIIGERGAMNDKTQEGLARLANLEVARQMESELNPDWSAKEDENALKIKIATGWERGADGKWRYEVDDIHIKPAKEWLLSKKKLTLKDIVEPNPVFDMYPELLEITIVKDKSKYNLSAWYDESTKQMKLPIGALKDDYTAMMDYYGEEQSDGNFARYWRVMEEDFLHEIQHAIQHREGFARGGSPEMMLPEDYEAYKKLYDEMSDLIDTYNSIPYRERNMAYAVSTRNMAQRAKDAVSTFVRRHKLGEERYRRLAGEVESSNVVNRSKLSDHERYNSLLASTEDVARKDQIFLMNSVQTTESSVRFRMSNNNQAIFVSNAAKAVEGIKQEKATPEQWLKMLEKAGGLKAGEDKWMGFSDWLKASDKKTLTKAEVLDFINENMIVIEEQHYQMFFQDDIDEATEKNMIEKYGEEFMSKFFGDAFIVEDDMRFGWRLAIFNEETAAQLYNQLNGTSVKPGEYGFDTEDYDIIVNWGTKIVRDAETINGVRRINDTRETYQSKGLTNRHEIALTVPSIESWNEADTIHFGEAGEGRAVAWIRFGDTIAEVPTEAEKHAWEELGKFMEQLQEKYGDSDAWTLEESKHYSDLLAATKTNREQKKVLVLDEIQSKRHQDAREMGGYRATDVDKWLADHEIEVKETGEFYEFYYKDGELDRRFSKGLLHYNIEEAKKLYVSGYNRSNVPDAPFEKNWHELAMKRMLRYAAENGYDVIAWTKGDQQNKRYNLSKVVDHIQLGMDFTKQKESSIRMYLKNGDSHHVGVNRETGLITFYNENKKAIGKPLSALLGKEVAEKVLSGKDYQILTDVDFELSKGMKGFYDEMLPAFMNKYGKQWGIKVENIFLNRVEEGISMHSIPVTEEMKASVMEGQVMFRVRGENESAEDFYSSAIEDYKAKYTSLADIVLYPVNDETADMFGYTREELAQIGAVYVIEDGEFAIFALEDIDDSQIVENILFHESIHFVSNFYSHMENLGKWLWNNPNQVARFVEWKGHIEERYPKDRHYDEMLAYCVAEAMSYGNVTALEGVVPSEYHSIIRQLENEIGYDRRSEESGREAERLLQQSGRSEDLGEQEGVQGEKGSTEKSGLTAEERRVINEFFPSAFRVTDSKGNTLTPAQEAFFANSKAVDKDGNLLVLYHGTPRAGFTEFKSGWFTTSKEDAISYSGDRKGRLFDPNEQYVPETLEAGDFRLGYMTFDSEADRDAFLAEYPEAAEAMSEREFDQMTLEADEEYDALIARKPELQKIWNAYREYERDRMVDTTIADVLRNPRAYTEEDIRRAIYAIDFNTILDSVDEIDDEMRRKSELFHILNEMNEDADGSYSDIKVPTRVPRNGKGVAYNDASARTYEVYINVEHPYEIDAKGKGSEFVSGDIYKAVRNALADEQYDGVIIRNWRVGRNQQLGDVVVPKNGSQIKLTSNQSPTENEDIRFSVTAKEARNILDNYESGSDESLMDEVENALDILESSRLGELVSEYRKERAAGEERGERWVDVEDIVSEVLSILDTLAGGAIPVSYPASVNKLSKRVDELKKEYNDKYGDIDLDEWEPADKERYLSAIREYLDALRKPSFRTTELNEESDLRFSVRTKPAPTKTKTVYKMVRLGKDGQPYPLFIGSAEPMPVKTWLDADSPNLGDLKKLPSGVHLINTKTGESMTLAEFEKEHPEMKNNSKVAKNPTPEAINWATMNGMRFIKIEDKKAKQSRYAGEKRAYYNLGIDGAGSVSKYGMRPGWHAGSHPVMRQIGNGPEKNLRADNLVWVRGRVSADIDYQEEANANPGNDIPTHIPTDGYYVKATNANAKASQADRMGWYIAGSFIIDEFISDAEARRVIDEWNKDHPDKKLEYDFPRESGIDFDPDTDPRLNRTSFRVTGTPTEQVVAEGMSLSPAEMATLAGNIFAALPEESRKKIVDSLGDNILNLQDAIMQIPARLATKEEWNDEDRQMAEVVAEQMTKAVGKDMTRPFTANEALWMLYNATNKSTDLVSEASRVLVRRNLGFDPQTQQILDDAGNGVRFRSVGDASVNATAHLYNRGSANVWTRIKESFVDMNASVEKLVKAIEKNSRKAVQGFENVLMALNQQSSRGLAAMESYTQKYLNPMFDEISKVMRDANKKYEDVVRYVILKHGLERNIKLAARDARSYYQEIYDDIIAKIKSMNDSQKRTYLTNAQLKNADAKAELARLLAVDQTTLTEDQLRELKRDLAKARKAVAETDVQLERARKIRNMSEQEAKDELDKIFENIEKGKDGKFQELRKNDYSGISSMFYDQLGVDRTDWQTEEEYQAALMRAKQDRFNSLEDVEAEAQKEVTDFEKTAKTDNLWKAINAATKQTLRQQYEANMISQDQYRNLRDMFEFYVPLRGFADNTAEDMYTYYRRPNSTGYTKPILGAEGRKTEAESPFGWIASMAGSAIASNVKNEAKLALFYFVSNRPDNGIATVSKTWYVHTPGDVDEDGKRIFKPKYPTFDEDLSTAEAKAEYEVWQAQMKDLQKQGLAYESGQRLNLGNAVVNIDSKDKPQHIVTVKVGGKDYTILINGNPRAAQAINGDLNIEATAGDYSMVFGPMLRWMSSVNTSYNPEFWITNMMRDMLFTAMAVNIKESPAYRRKFVKNYAKALKVVKLNAQNEEGNLGDGYLDRMYKDFVKYGGVTGYTQIKDNETWEREIEKYLKSNNPSDLKAGVALKKMQKFFHGMHRFGESLEQISRFAAFVTSREMGKSMSEAINDAKEITVNFNRKGSGKMVTYEESKYLTDANGQPLNKFERWMVVGFTSIAPLGRRFIMFFNAAIQGLNATYQLWKKNKVRSTAWALGYAAVGVMNAVLHALMDDDDDYLDIPEYERRNSLMIGWNGTYAKWALPQEARAFYALGDLAVETLLGRNKHKEFLGMHGSIPALLDGMTGIFGEVLPINPTEGWKAFMPSIAIPFIEIALNKDYKGAPIYNDLKWLTEEERARTERWAKAYRGTGKMYIDMSKLLNNLTDSSDLDEVGFINLPPEVIEHIVQSAFGGTIRTVDKFVNTVTAAIDPETEVTVRQFPFVNRFLTMNDERYRNVHVNDVYDYYAAEAEYVIDLQNQYNRAKDFAAIEWLKQTEEYRWAEIYKKHVGAIKRKQNEIKAAEGNAERSRLMKEQDELKRQMIKEISDL